MKELVVGDDQLILKKVEGVQLAHYKGIPYSGKSKGNFRSSDGRALDKSNWKDGRKDGLTTFYCGCGTDAKVEVNYKNGEYDGLTASWYENGQKGTWENWKDGKIISADTWKPNGDKCPVTSIKDCNGVVIEYYENGQPQYEKHYLEGVLDGAWIEYYNNGEQMKRHTYKDGKRVRD